MEFQKKYQTEQDCEKRLFELRWPQGFVCPSCGHHDYYFGSKRKLLSVPLLLKDSYGTR
ncbi:MAG: transposase [Deltaproteobacteria bacterium]|nr:transposase [Deltaproteobacteria bacterium]